jgi:hypothetical protein
MIKLAAFTRDPEFSQATKDNQLRMIGQLRKMITAGSYGCFSITVELSEMTKSVATNTEYKIATTRLVVFIGTL